MAGLKKRVLEKAFKEDLKELTKVEGRTETELVPDNRNLVRERERWPQNFVQKDRILDTRVSVEEWSCREGV